MPILTLVLAGSENRLRFNRVVAWLALVVVSALAPSFDASALEGISIPLDGRTLDLTNKVQLFRQAEDRIQISTAPGADGIVRRIEVRAKESDGGGSRWAVFALTNNGDEQIDRL